ncbi:hypothetical protein OOT46_16335 [Aquabacterium sp. A7-Y]|uniref:hypothetical protein n=1 Tax=Aquabacterium sp. A7-Y TaxID=1349605 RepID=UPI00223DA45C|nr:hypothetical protein [Aquabacterium sp. A7-Y]MCW7539412.1 hypothetical protein [Aquabacterium sp. A7-Y]
MAPFTLLFRRLAVAAFGLLAFLVGLLIAGLLLAAGAATVAGLMGWSLLRGRRPALRWRVGRLGVSPFFRSAAPRPGDAADVVDVVAREVPPSPPVSLARDGR